jgi:hypothetical protein
MSFSVSAGAQSAALAIDPFVVGQHATLSNGGMHFGVNNSIDASSMRPSSTADVLGPTSWQFFIVETDALRVTGCAVSVENKRSPLLRGDLPSANLLCGFWSLQINRHRPYDPVHDEMVRT